MTFVASNGGKFMHEFVLGPRETIDEHATLMAKFADVEHDEPYMAHVPLARAGRSPGASSTATATSSSPASSPDTTRRA